MDTARSSHPSPRFRACLGLVIGLAVLIPALSPPAKADEGRYRHGFERQHAMPYRHHEPSFSHGWRHHRHHEPYCTTRAVSYWDGFWSQWRTRIVRECW